MSHFGIVQQVIDVWFLSITGGRDGNNATMCVLVCIPLVEYSMNTISSTRSLLVLLELNLHAAVCCGRYTLWHSSAELYAHLYSVFLECL